MRFLALIDRTESDVMGSFMKKVITHKKQIDSCEHRALVEV